MKQFICVFFLLFASTAYANKEEVMVRSDESHGPRSLINIPPTVIIDDDFFELSMCFPVQGERYSVVIVNEEGDTTAQLYITSDVNFQTYLLPALNIGSYTITLVSNSSKYVGCFEIE